MICEYPHISTWDWWGREGVGGHANNVFAILFKRRLDMFNEIILSFAVTNNSRAFIP